jgi:hypothetical protein
MGRVEGGARFTTSLDSAGSLLSVAQEASGEKKNKPSKISLLRRYMSTA